MYPEHKHLATFNDVVRAAIDYYIYDVTTMTDYEYDSKVRILQENWDELTGWMRYILGDRETVSLFDIQAKLTPTQYKYYTMRRNDNN